MNPNLSETRRRNSLGNLSSFMTKNADCAVELIELNRFLNHGDRPAGKNLGEDFAVGVARDDHDWHVRMEFLEFGVELVSGNIGKLEIEEDEIEALAFGEAECFRAGSHDNSSESGFFQELLKESLKGWVIVHHKHSGLARFFISENVAVEKTALDAPPATNLDGWQLSALDKVVNCWKGDAEVFRCFFNS